MVGRSLRDPRMVSQSEHLVLLKGDRGPTGNEQEGSWGLELGRGAWRICGRALRPERPWGSWASELVKLFVASHWIVH